MTGERMARSKLASVSSAFVNWVDISASIESKNREVAAAETSSALANRLFVVTSTQVDNLRRQTTYQRRLATEGTTFCRKGPLLTDWGDLVST
jgi:hypothetical protein